MYFMMAQPCSTTGFCGETHGSHMRTAGINSRLSALRLFISTDELIRVGGRLANAPLSFSEKQPILLAKSSHLLLVNETYALVLQSGLQLIRSVLSY